MKQTMTIDLKKRIYEKCRKCNHPLASYESRLLGYCGMCQRTIKPERCPERPNIPRPGFIRKGCVRDGNVCPGCGIIHPRLRGEANVKSRVDGYWKDYLIRIGGGARMKYQSAKVYVVDFHFDSDSKVEIAKEKEELDKFFDKLRNELETTHPDCEVFLRKH